MELAKAIQNILESSTEVDPAKLARKLIMQQTAKEQQEGYAQCLADRIRIDIGRSRLEDYEVARSRPGQSKLSIYHQRVFVNDAFKMLSDCTAEDLHWIADMRDHEGEQLKAKATKYRKMATQLEKSSCATLGEYARKKRKVA
jgi:hypothetical protein